jgi:hypothetical protein
MLLLSDVCTSVATGRLWCPGQRHTAYGVDRQRCIHPASKVRSVTRISAIEPNRQHIGMVCSGRSQLVHTIGLSSCFFAAAPAQVAIVQLLKSGLVVPSSVTCSFRFPRPSTSHALLFTPPQSNALLGSPHSKIDSFSPPRLHFAFSFPRHPAPPTHIRPTTNQAEATHSVSLRHSLLTRPSSQPKNRGINDHHMSLRPTGRAWCRSSVVLRGTPSSCGVLHHRPLWSCLCCE